MTRIRELTWNSYRIRTVTARALARARPFGDFVVLLGRSARASGSTLSLDSIEPSPRRFSRSC